MSSFLRVQFTFQPLLKNSSVLFRFPFLLKYNNGEKYMYPKYTV